MPKRVKITKEFTEHERGYIRKEMREYMSDINKDGHPKREALKKKVCDKQHEFFKKKQAGR